MFGFRDEIKLIDNKNTGDIHKIDCTNCKIKTNHKILKDVHIDGDQIDEQHGSVFQWQEDYQIMQCQGCDNIVFRNLNSNSENFDPVEGYIIQENIYPNPNKGREPMDYIHIVSPELNRIYSETLLALNSKQPVLTGIGIRAIIETVCKDKKAKGKDLYNKIDNLKEMGVLTSDGTDILHKLRTLGNNAAHEVKPHSPIELGLAFDVIEYLLNGVYILPKLSESTFKQ